MYNTTETYKYVKICLIQNQKMWFDNTKSTETMKILKTIKD